MSVEIPKKISQIIKNVRHFESSLKTDQNIKANAICSEGDWLKGESNIFKNQNGSPKTALDTSGFTNENRKGNATKNIPAVMVTKSILLVNIFNCSYVLHEKNTVQKNSPLAIYGIIDKGMNGICFSNVKTNEGTFSREEAYPAE